MCDFHTDLPPLHSDEYRLDTPRVRGFVARVRERIDLLLANDTGCVWRHTYDERTGATSPFRSGYVNAECVET